MQDFYHQQQYKDLGLWYWDLVSKLRVIVDRAVL